MCRLVMSLLLGLLGTGLVAAEKDPTTRHVSVTGTAVTRVAPDTVIWSIRVQRRDKELARAQAECDQVVKNLLGLRGELQLKPEDVQTGNLSIQKIYDRDQAGNQTSFRHFLVDRTVTLRQSDTNHFDELLARLVANMDIEVGFSLQSSEYQAMRAKTRLDAVKAAQQKAAAMTELLDAKLGRVLRIGEPQESHGSLFNTANNYISAVRTAEADQTSGTFSPGEIEIRVSIEVTFEIE